MTQEEISQKAFDDVMSDPKNISYIEKYKKEQDGRLNFLIGYGMKISKGSANPQMLREILKKMLN